MALEHLSRLNPAPRRAATPDRESLPGEESHTGVASVSGITGATVQLLMDVGECVRPLP
jgi:hypothetical protein